MIRYLLLSSLLLITLELKADGDTLHKLRFNINAGVSVPLLAYGASDTNTTKMSDTAHKNGFAKTGYHFDASLQYRFSKHFGGILSVGGNINSFNGSTYSSEYFPRATNGTSVISSGSFYIGEYMGGVFASYPAGAKFNFQIQVSAGFITANYPVITVSGTSQSVTTTEITTTNNAVCFGYNGSVTCMYKLSKISGITLKAGYTGSNVNYPGYTTTVTLTGFPTYYPEPHSSNVLMTLGLLELFIVTLQKFPIVPQTFVSNKDESVVMFRSKLLDMFTRIHWTVPLFLYVPVVLYFLYRSVFIVHLGILSIIGLYIGGVASWTLIEYLLHRFVFHTELPGKLGKRIHFIVHGVHHDYPNDTLRLVMVPSLSIPLAFIFYFSFRFILGPSLICPFFAGLVTGYLFYDITHYSLHHYPFKRKFWVQMKVHHMRHHYQEPHRGYGVSSTFWDHVFRSMFTGRTVNDKK
jgi:sterol desaturase/sphingolipid hydroxylase (fatty acid hydroxylase superfamily)